MYWVYNRIKIKFIDAKKRKVNLISFISELGNGVSPSKISS